MITIDLDTNTYKSISPIVLFYPSLGVYASVLLACVVPAVKRSIDQCMANVRAAQPLCI